MFDRILASRDVGIACRIGTGLQLRRSAFGIGTFIAACFLFNLQSLSAQEAAQRVTSGLQVLYDFRQAANGVVPDSGSAEKTRLPLRIRDANVARAQADGLLIQGKSLITSDVPADRLTSAMKESRSISVEVWLKPQSLDQKGPARIVTLSKSGNERNYTLGQDGDKLDFRLRTTSTNTNGIPSLATNIALRIATTHVVCTHNAESGKTRIYVNGEQVAEQDLKGDFANWDNGYHLGIGNELSGDRPWQGLISLVAVFSRELSPADIRQNFTAGLPAAATAKLLTKADLNAREFETSVAPILSRHCLECHDASTHKGGLDLSERERALKGGDGGAVVISGKSSDSLLWQRVNADEMPHDRTPLSAGEKDTLKKWIDDGAEWRLPVIDPANYIHGNSSQSVFVQRLTVSEYVESVRTLLGIDVAQQAREILPADLRADGFSNTAYNLTVDLAHVEAHMKMAELIVEQIDATELAKRFTKSRELSDENLEKFVAPFGRLILRGPLSEREQQNYLGVSTSVAAAGGDFDEIIRYIVAAMLQSPRFLYRIESQRGDGTQWPVNSLELASRLSFILWGGPPDEVLLSAAEKNELTSDALKVQVARMLNDPRAVRRSKEFISEWLNLGHLRNLQPEVRRFPNWNAELADDMREETLAFFEDIVWTQRRPMADLLNAQVTFVTPRLARYYGLPVADQDVVPNADAKQQLIRVDLTNVAARGGLLTQGSTLTIGGDDASMVTRGLFVMHELLRGVVKDPPPCVDATPTPSQPGLTQRAIAELRLSNTSCLGCHARFEPLSFGLEKYDGLGAYHEKDEFGNGLREDGKILFPGESQSINYQTSAELMNLLASSERVKESITWKMVQFAVGRPLGAEDAGVMADIYKTSQAAGGTWPEIMTAIVLSDLVQTTRTEPDTTP